MTSVLAEPRWKDSPVHRPARPMNAAGLQSVREYRAAVWGAWFAGHDESDYPEVPQLAIPNPSVSPMRRVSESDRLNARIVAPRLGNAIVRPGAVYEVAFLVALWNWQGEWDGRATVSAHSFALRLQDHFFKSDLRGADGWELLGCLDRANLIEIWLAPGGDGKPRRMSVQDS